MASIVKVIQNNVEKIVTVDGQILQAPAGAGDSAIYNSPVATKGSVSSHSINITPSFTVTSAGNINTGTITGTPVTVQASELVSGTRSIDSNGTNIDVTNYSMVDVSVPTSGGNIQTSKSYTVSSSGAQAINPDSGYDGMAEVSLSVPTGVATSASSITASSATITTGTNTITLSKSVSNTPRITTAGYISSGTAGSSSISLSASVTTKAAATITPGTTNQTIASGTYLTGTQTISGDANLIASNIKNGVPIFGVIGNYTGSSGSTYGTYVASNITQLQITGLTQRPAVIAGFCDSTTFTSNQIGSFMIFGTGTYQNMAYIYSGSTFQPYSGYLTTSYSNGVLSITASSIKFKTSSDGYMIVYSY